MKKNICVFWHRRDLRINDNAGLYQALKHEKNVQPVFIFDRHILDALENKTDARVEFIYQAIEDLHKAYQKHGASLWVFNDTPEAVFKKLCSEYDVSAVYTNRDYEPYAHKRDKSIFTFLEKKQIPFKGYKDHVIFEKNEIVKTDGTPYTVYTPYSKKWKEKLNAFYIKAYPVAKYARALHQDHGHTLPSLKTLGFEPAGIPFPSTKINHALIHNYANTRDFPGIKGTSHFGLHLRFGTISIRHLVSEAKKESQVYLNELIWREFYQAIIYHYPHTVSDAFKPAYDHIVWRNNKKEFEAWCNGKTGYPIVDAGMREINATGFMHNRVRMIVASFLTKHLLIDWRWGEAYFAKKLLDYELGSNIGNWQWAAGCGCDAAPYFRVFNPTIQAKKFDPDLKYIKKWVPEYGTEKYPAPIVEHTFARERVLEAFKKALNRK